MSHPPRRKFWSRRVVLTIAVIAVLAVAGVTAYLVYQQQGCGNTLVGCGPYPYPAIQSAQAYVNSAGLGFSSCQFTSTSTVAICGIFMKAGASGYVTANVFNKNQQSGQGGNRAQFLVYSSDVQFINFTSIPTCAYTSAPTFDSPSCNVDMQTQTFQFNFEISPSYVAPLSSAARQDASITVVIYQSCCWP